jgi:hypothetical protein
MKIWSKSIKSLHCAQCSQQFTCVQRHNRSLHGTRKLLSPVHHSVATRSSTHPHVHLVAQYVGTVTRAVHPPIKHTLCRCKACCHILSSTAPPVTCTGDALAHSRAVATGVAHASGPGLILGMCQGCCVQLCIDGQIAQTVLTACCVHQGEQLGVKTASGRGSGGIAGWWRPRPCERKRTAQAEGAAAKCMAVSDGSTKCQLDTWSVSSSDSGLRKTQQAQKLLDC